jgi:GTP cyclohydrolase I
MSKVDYAKLIQIGSDILVAIGEDLDREGLKETPRRFADSWKEFIEYEPGNHETLFESVTADQMVLVSGMRVWSLCEHHLLPFWCDVSVAYIADKRILGLSKFGRIAQHFAHRLQVQERLVHQIAGTVIQVTGNQNVGVIATGEHLCMTMRGVKMPAKMTSSSLNGLFRTDPTVRKEFLDLWANQSR